MTFDWMQYLEVSKILASDSAHPFIAEGMFRSSVSRAYYCAYHHAFRAAIDTGFNPHKYEKKEYHRGIVNHFIGSKDLAMKKIGQNLERILNARQECDYEQRLTSIPKSMATQAIYTAEQIVLWTSAFIK